MPAKNFKPPEHIETHVAIVDSKTGEVLATETRWTDVDADVAGGGPSRELLASIAADSGRDASELDVLQTDYLPGGPLRADLQTRQVVQAPVGPEPSTVEPPRLPRP